MEISTRLLLFLVLFLVLYFFKIKRKRDKHSKNIKKSSMILKKINSFEYPGQKINYLRKIDPYVFEELLLTAFEIKGFSIKRNKKYSGDGGLDGTIYDKNKNKILIQAKRYSSYINSEHIKDFSALIIKEKAMKGYFIHTGKSSKIIRKSFNHSNIEIIGGTKLISLLS